LYLIDFETKNNVPEFDCSQFIDDYDILRQFPFPTTIYLADDDEHKYGISAAFMDENNTFVETLAIYNEKVVPWSVFCLTNLEMLLIDHTPFENGNFVSV
jgi:hypothetical protein